MPILGAGGAMGLTYREPIGSGVNDPYSSQGLTFTMSVDPSRQNYVTVKVWGGDAPTTQMYLLNAPSTYPFMINDSTPPVFPGRFEYYTFPIPITWTSGKSSTQVTLNFVDTFDAYGGTGFHFLAKGELTQPIYSAFTHTDPEFVPDNSDPTGTKPSQSGQVTLSTLTASQATAILTTNRNNIYAGGSSSYYTKLINRQVLTTSPGSPPAQVIGLDLFTDATTWGSAGKTAAQWDSQIAVQKPAPGYTAFPDELLSALTTTYLLPPLSGVTISGEPAQYDSTILSRIVSSLDGASYMQGSDGGFPNNGQSWVGLVSNLPSAPTARTAVGSGGYLEGANTQTLGWTIIKLLNNPTAAGAFQTYLGQSYNADLTNGGSMLRATAYERMLYNHIGYLTTYTGGAESQQLFQMTALYACQIALEKLQALYPNASYVYSESTALNYVKMVMGLAPDTLRNLDATGTGFTNYGLSAKGLGEEYGTLSGGFDGGYGLWETMFAPDIAALSAFDPGIDAATKANVIAMGKATIDAFNQFISPLDYISGGTDTFTMGPENFITYRNNDNPNETSVSAADGTTRAFLVDSRYLASDPSGVINDAYAVRSAYLEAEYGITPYITADGHYEPRLNYLRDLGAYESTINSLVGVNPATMTALPGEPNQADYAWADPTTGAVAVHNDGEWLFVNTNWRNKDSNSNSFSNLVPSEIARIHYTTATIDRAAMVYLPYNAATQQSDGNLSGNMSQPWFVRYGDYLIDINHSSSSSTAKLPSGTGYAEDLLTHTFYRFGSSVSVPANSAAIFWLAAPAVTGGGDVGAVGIAGSDSYAATTRVYTMTGSGADINGTADAFHFVSTSITGNANVIAQVLSQTASDASAQAGVMLRDGTAANAAFAAVVRTPSNGIRFEWRPTTGGPVAWAAAPTPLTNVFVRVARTSSNTVAGLYSTDGSNWTQIGTGQSITLPSTVKAGLVVCSHNNATTSTATFGSVVVSSDGQTGFDNMAPTIATPASASATTVTGTNVNLSALATDDGGAVNLTYTWGVVGSSPVTFSGATNGTNAAKNITATFLADGTYQFRVTITDTGGLSTTSDVTVTVTQTASSLGVYPNTGPVYVTTGGSQAFTISVLDQFGSIIPGASATPTWSLVSGSVGSIDPSTGTYTAPTTGGGNATIKATAGALTGTAALTVIGPTFTASQDIGVPNQPGSVAFTTTNGGTYTVTGGGLDIWVDNDQFRFVYVPVTGDVTITAHVASISNSDPTNGWAKCGVMFRASLDRQSAYAFMSETYSKGPNFQWRANNGGSPGQSYVGSGPNNGWVRLVRSGNTFTSYYSTDGVTWNQNAISTQTITMDATVYVGLVVNAHNVNGLNTTVFDNVTLTTTTPTPTFPADTDIGSPHPLGSYNEAGGVATIVAGGADIYSTSDQFHFAYIPITVPSGGSVTITARVTSLANTNTNAKAGVMIRNTLAANSAFLDSVVTASNGLDLDYRTSAGGGSSETKLTGVSAPYWVRVVRSGSTLSAWAAVDNSGTPGTFVQVGSNHTITMNQTAYVGLCVTSHVDGTPATATFDHITVSSAGGAATDVAPNIATAPTPASNPVATASVALSALGADTDGGGESNLIYTWAALRYPNSTPVAVTFSANATNAAKNTTATFTRAGTYLIRMTVTDQGNASVSSAVSVTVNQTLTSIAVSPASPSVSPGASQQFTAAALDQFGQPMASQPSFTWSLSSGSGSIDSTGLYTAALTGNSATVQASGVGTGKSGSTNVSISNQSPLVADSTMPTAGNGALTGVPLSLNALGVDDSGESNLIYTWATVGSPPGPVSFSNSGSNAAKHTSATFTIPGTYTLAVTIQDPASQTATASVTVTVGLGVISGTSGDDTIRLAHDGSALDVFINSPSTPTYSVPFSSVTSPVTVGGGAGNDNITIDFSGSGGSPVPSAGVTVDGGTANTVDTLTILGTAGADSSTVNSSTVVFNSTSMIAYANVESIAVQSNGGDDVLTQSAQPGNSAALAYTGNGTGNLTLNVNAGSYASLTDAGATSANFTINVAGGASVAFTSDQHVTSLTLADNAAASVAPSATAASPAVLNIASLAFNGPGARFDLTNNQLITTAALGDVQTDISSSQLRSSSITGGNATALGYLSLGNGSVEVRFTLLGDTDLNGAVNVSDLANLAGNFGVTTGATWINGDFDGNGNVNVADLADLAANFGQTLTSAGLSSSVASTTVATPVSPVNATPAARAVAEQPVLVIASTDASDWWRKKSARRLVILAL
jgi:hypothetical protein